MKNNFIFQVYVLFILTLIVIGGHIRFLQLERIEANLEALVASQEALGEEYECLLNVDLINQFIDEQSKLNTIQNEFNGAVVDAVK